MGHFKNRGLENIIKMDLKETVLETEGSESDHSVVGCCERGN